MSQTKSYIGKGKIFVEEIGGTGGAQPLGNCSALNLAINEDKKEQKDYTEAGGATVNTVSRIDSVVATVTALDLSPENVALALRGLVTTVAGTAISAEAATVAAAGLGGFIAFANLYDPTIAVTVTDTGAATTYVEGTDYILESTGITTIDGGAIVAGQALEFNYTSKTHYTVETLTASGKEYKVYCSLLNEADGGSGVYAEMHRVVFNPTQALDLISDEYGELELSFDLIKDETITGSTLSKFIKLKMP